MLVPSADHSVAAVRRDTSQMTVVSFHASDWNVQEEGSGAAVPSRYTRMQNWKESSMDIHPGWVTQCWRRGTCTEACTEAPAAARTAAPGGAATPPGAPWPTGCDRSTALGVLEADLQQRGQQRQVAPRRRQVRR